MTVYVGVPAPEPETTDGTTAEPTTGEEPTAGDAGSGASSSSDTSSDAGAGRESSGGEDGCAWDLSSPAPPGSLAALLALLGLRRRRRGDE